METINTHKKLSPFALFIKCAMTAADSHLSIVGIEGGASATQMVNDIRKAIIMDNFASIAAKEIYRNAKGDGIGIYKRAYDMAYLAMATEADPTSPIGHFTPFVLDAYGRADVWLNTHLEIPHEHMGYVTLGDFLRGDMDFTGYRADTEEICNVLGMVLGYLRLPNCGHTKLPEKYAHFVKTAQG